MNAMERIHFSIKNCGMIKKSDSLNSIDDEESSSPFIEPNYDLTHFFCFNYVFSEDDSYYIAQRLKNTPSVKVLIWCSDKSKTLNKFGLVNFEYVKKVPLKLQGSG